MNLLSVSKITDKEYSVLFDEGKAAIIDKQGETKLIAKRKDNLYYVEHKIFDSCQQITAEISGEFKSSTNSVQIWHERMAHLNFGDLLCAVNKGFIRGININQESDHEACQTCLQGKMTRLPFPKESQHVTKKLELIHTDLCGPMRVTLNGGAKYFITFTDDYSRWTEIRFLKHKNEALREFKALKAVIEKQYGVHIKAIQSNNGLEYVNKSSTNIYRLKEYNID